METRNLVGSFVNADGDDTTGTLYVKPVNPTPADADVGVLTTATKAWDVTSGAIEDGATIVGGATYQFKLVDSQNRTIKLFTSGVSDIADDVDIADLYLDSEDVDPIAASRVYEGDTVTRLDAPAGSSTGNFLVVGAGGTITYSSGTPGTVVTVTCTAGASLGGRRVVLLDAAGKAQYADKDTTAHAGRVLGLTTAAAALDESISVQVAGLLTENTWAWDTDTPVYLSTNGLLTQTAPTSGMIQIIGQPLSATTINVDIKNTILLA